jgi:hypothetical protein
LADPEHEAKSDGPEGNGADRKIHEVLHDDVDGIFSSGKAGFHHGEPGLHEKDQGGGHKRPEIIGVGLDKIDGLFVAQDGGCRVFGPCPEGAGQQDSYNGQKVFDGFHWTCFSFRKW